jgi:hypothetical protein
MEEALPCVPAVGGRVPVLGTCVRDSKSCWFARYAQSENRGLVLRECPSASLKQAVSRVLHGGTCELSFAGTVPAKAAL